MILNPDETISHYHIANYTYGINTTHDRRKTSPNLSTPRPLADEEQDLKAPAGELSEYRMFLRRG